MRKGEGAALARLINEMGAEVMVSVRDHVPADRRILPFARVKAEEYVADCRLCGMCTDASPPITAEWPGGLLTGRARIAVIGDAVTRDGVRAGKPFAGRPRQVLRSALEQAGIDPDDVAYMNVVAGYPQIDGTPRAIHAFERDTCSANLYAQLEAADVRYVLLMGAVATSVWRTDLRLTELAGKLFVWRGRWFVWPMWHPNAILRQSYDARVWRTQLARFAQIVADDAGLGELEVKCFVCGSDIYSYDSTGVAWCRSHFGENFVQGVKQAAGTGTRDGRTTRAVEPALQLEGTI